MAWRFHEHILRGELDNTVRGHVTGRIWLAGIAEPMTLDLRGDCAPDLVGCTMTFENPAPVPFTDSPPNLEQRGWVGDITASRKCKIHDVPMEEVMRLYKLRQPAPWHWASTLYLEWHSTTNGGITIQTAEFKITVSMPAWTFAPGEYEASREASGREFIEWSKAEFGWTDADLQASENADDKFDENEGEEWKHADDDVTRTILSAEPPILSAEPPPPNAGSHGIGTASPDATEPDPMLIFDPIEDAEWMPARDILIQYGFTPLRPHEVSDAHLRGRLWELIYALAGRRIFLRYTDHLGDRALYEWLDTFLDEPCADCPSEAETNYRVDVSDATNCGDEQTWLRFFASEKERAEWKRDFRDCPMPRREKPPHDRDRFLPEPPLPRSAWTPPPDENDEPPFEVADSADVDREIRIGKLKDEIAEATGGEMSETKFADLPPAIEEAYLGQVRDIERDGWQHPMDELAKHHAAPLPPDELTDEALPPALWTLLHSLACRGFYVLHTDHLSDRALYEILWKKGLREEAILPGRSRTGGYFYDTIGSYGPEDLAIHHRYYETEKDRARHLAEFPNSTPPPREPPPFSRDWRLPKGPF